MTPRTPYMQEYYRQHREEIIKKVTDKYRIGVRQGKDIGTERKSAGLYDIVAKVDDKWRVIGELEWLYSGRWKCAAGTFTTRGAALEAMKGLLA